MSQFLCSGVNSCETTNTKPKLAPSLGEGIKLGRLGIQGSNQIRIEASFPTWKPAALATRCLMPIKLFQKGEVLPVKGVGKPIISNLVFCFQQLNTKTILSWNNPPAKFGEESLVEVPEVSETQASLLLGPTQRRPWHRSPVRTWFCFWIPPKSTKWSIKLVTQAFRVDIIRILMLFIFLI